MPDPRYRVLTVATHPVQYIGTDLPPHGHPPLPSISRSLIALFAAPKPVTIPNLAPTFNGTFLSSTVTPGPTSAIAAPAHNPSSASCIPASGTSFTGAISMP